MASAHGKMKACSALSLGDFLFELLAIGDKYHVDHFKALTLKLLSPFLDIDNLVEFYKVQRGVPHTLPSSPPPSSPSSSY